MNFPKTKVREYVVVVVLESSVHTNGRTPMDE